MTTIAQDEPRPVTGGVDTHKDVHVAAVLDAVGRLIATASFPTTRHGYRRMLRWMQSHGELAAVGVEGCGSWGAGLARYLAERGVNVLEVKRPNRQNRRLRGKSDTVDAEAAARAVLNGKATVTLKAGTGPVEAVRQLRIARSGAMKARTTAEGLSKPEIMRCLKRYVARELYPLIQATTASSPLEQGEAIGSQIAA